MHVLAIVQARNALNLHFSSCPVDSADRHPIGLGERRLLQSRCQQRRERGGREAIGKSAAGGGLARAEYTEFRQRLAQQSRGRMGLLHPQFEVGAGDLNAGPQQMRSRPPCGAAAHTASSTSCDSQKYPASLSAIP